MYRRKGNDKNKNKIKIKKKFHRIASNINFFLSPYFIIVVLKFQCDCLFLSAIRVIKMKLENWNGM